jgi:hypothetical protein
MIGDEESLVVKSGDGNIQLVKDYLAINALPKDLVKEITVDVSHIIDVNDVIFVKDLKLPSGVEIEDDLEQVIVSVFDLKKMAAAEEAAEEAAAVAATEVAEENATQDVA